MKPPVPDKMKKWEYWSVRINYKSKTRTQEAQAWSIVSNIESLTWIHCCLPWTDAAKNTVKKAAPVISRLIFFWKLSKLEPAFRSNYPHNEVCTVCNYQRIKIYQYVLYRSIRCSACFVLPSFQTLGMRSCKHISTSNLYKSSEIAQFHP